jgi:hypothetical protein
LKAAGYKTRGSTQLLGVKGGFQLAVPTPAIAFSGSSRKNAIRFELRLGAYLANVEDILSRYAAFQDDATMKQHPHLAGLRPKRPIPWTNLTCSIHAVQQRFLINDDRNRASLAMLVDRCAASLSGFTIDNLIDRLRTTTSSEAPPLWAVHIASRVVVVRDLCRSNLPSDQDLLEWVKPVEPPGGEARLKLLPFIEWWRIQLQSGAQPAGALR